MPDTPTAERIVIDGRPHWKYPPTERYPDGLVLPVIAGGSPEADEDEGDRGGDRGRADDAAARAAAGRRGDEDDANVGGSADEDRPLGERGEAALASERAARRRAEREAREAKAALRRREDADLTETERLKKEAEEGRARGEAATAKLRKATLLAELTKDEHGIADARAATALAIADGLFEFDDDDEPTNAERAVEQLLAAYPVLRGKKGKKAPTVDGGAGGGGGGGDTPDLTADELAAARACGMTPEEYQKYKSPQPQVAAT